MPGFLTRLWNRSSNGSEEQPAENEILHPSPFQPGRWLNFDNYNIPHNDRGNLFASTPYDSFSNLMEREQLYTRVRNNRAGYYGDGNNVFEAHPWIYNIEHRNLHGSLIFSIDIENGIINIGEGYTPSEAADEFLLRLIEMASTIFGR